MVGEGRIEAVFSHHSQTLHPINTEKKAATQLHHGFEYHKMYQFHQLKSGKNLDSTINFYFHFLINVSLNNRIQPTNLQQHKMYLLTVCVAETCCTKQR
jgi:hypothetical protein